MLAAALALTLAFAPAPTPAPFEAEAAELAAQGQLQLAPTRAGRYLILDPDGEPAHAPLELDGQTPATLELPVGLYFIHGPRGVASVRVEADGHMTWDGAELLPTAQWQVERAAAQKAATERAAAEQAAALEAAAAEQAAAEQAEAEALAQAQAQAALDERKNWRRWGSPLGSLFVPGLGQFFNGEGGKGTGLLFASIGSVAGAVALYSIPNDGTRPAGAEYARLIGYGLFSTAAPVLWIYSIADAYRVATKSEIEPLVDHQVRLSFTRMMSVGFRADPTRPGFYDDWSVSIMGQATKRLSVGVSDLSVKANGREGPQVWQFGARIDYRVLERRRVWLDLALGSILQVASGQEARELDPDLAVPPRQLRFGAVPYGQLDLRIFVLDRMSLDLTPRLAVPVTTRYYSAARSLPRFAPMLELGAGVSAYF